MILLDEQQIKLIAGVAEAAADMLECNCALPACEGTCTHAEAKQVLEMLARKEDGQDSKQATVYREVAQARSRDGEIEVDDGSIVSFSEDGGAYVLAWIWVNATDASVCPKCGDMADNGEGWDGLCGNCADKVEKHEAAD